MTFERPKQEPPIPETVSPLEVPRIALERPALPSDNAANEIAELRAELDDISSPDAAAENVGKLNLEKTYAERFLPRIDEIVAAWNLEGAVAEAERLLDPRDPKTEANALMVLVKALRKIPHKKWSFFPDIMIKERSGNCSGKAFLLGEITKRLGFPVEYGCPVGHAVAVAKLSDGSRAYLDGANGVFARLGAERDPAFADVAAYGINKRGVEYSTVPVLPLEEGAMVAYLGNIKAMEGDAPNDPEAQRILGEYAASLDLAAAADPSTDDHPLNRLEENPAFRREGRRVARRRFLQRIPLVGRFF